MPHCAAGGRRRGAAGALLTTEAADRVTGGARRTARLAGRAVQRLGGHAGGVTTGAGRNGPTGVGQQEEREPHRCAGAGAVVTTRTGCPRHPRISTDTPTTGAGLVDRTPG